MSQSDKVKDSTRDMLLSSSPPNFVNFNTKAFSSNSQSVRNLEEKFNDMDVTNTAEKRAQGGDEGVERSRRISPPQPYQQYQNEPFVIGVAGGTASGKTTVCSEIIQRLSNQRVVIIAQDSFYRGLTKVSRASHFFSPGLGAPFSPAPALLLPVLVLC
mmetsp:Transcript_4316/g.12675  ORF Transcript_4316/g.12675 Transcript_4316/m.12675 type:complete len:158 (+) Transcript_4316:89-562(+)